MSKLLTILGLCALAALWSCSFTGQAGSEIQSCYDTGHGIVCTTSSELGDEEIDADGDGEEDELVCGDADSSSESMDGDDGETDDGETDDGETDDGETDDDAVMTATGEDDGEDDGEDEESDADGEESTSDSASEDCASSDGDDDNDGLDDGTDCDCGGTGDEPPPPPEDPCSDCTPPE